MINNNVLSGNCANGLDIETGLGVKILNNTIYGNGADGIFVVYPARSNQMQDVQIESNILDDPCPQNCSSPDLRAFESNATTPPVNQASAGWDQTSSSATITINAVATLSAKLAWNPNTESYLAGYNVYPSNQSGVFTSAPLDGSTLLTVPSFIDSTVQNGNTYYYPVRAVSTVVQSPYSISGY